MLLQITEVEYNQQPSPEALGAIEYLFVVICLRMKVTKSCSMTIMDL